MGVNQSEQRPPDFQYDRLDDLHRQVLEEAAAIAVDRATTGAGGQIRDTIRARGLGRLGNAVGTTSSLKKGRRTGSNPWGAIYARGGDDSLAGGALEAYGKGVTINPVKGNYLWFQTKALQRRIGNRRMTPERYIAAGSPLGKLIFRRKNSRVVELFVKGVTVSAKNGRARRPGPRSKAQTTISVLFIGIPITTRVQRFDSNQIVGLFADQVPLIIIDEVLKGLRRRGL